MRDGDILILKGRDVQTLLEDRENELLETVRRAYLAHAHGESCLPHSTFLNFRNEPRSRIIAMPAYLGEGFDVAGIKWIGSFPNNVQHGMDRASAVVILNSPLTGTPLAIIEGSVPSAKRTAASAALAARTLHPAPLEGSVGLIGCGLINFEILRFLHATLPGARRFAVFDLSRQRAEAFKDVCLNKFGDISVEIAADVTSVLAGCSLISVATTAVKPHLADLSPCVPGTTILHISLRDVTPEVVLSCDNVVDDVDHVCRAQTSVHLAKQLTGKDDFIRCTLSDVLLGQAPPRRDPESVLLFSPFGLGVLDLAVSELVYKLAREQGRGVIIDSFLPDSWQGNRYETC
jgi:N-[(2S)-2-amino-2-carboxyethyl]-L-glutamate dehydrogenase